MYCEETGEAGQGHEFLKRWKWQIVRLLEQSLAHKLVLSDWIAALTYGDFYDNPYFVLRLTSLLLVLRPSSLF